MKDIKEVLKKDIPLLMNDSSFWDHSFLSISKHRLWSHYHNPTCSDDDIVLLLAYIEDELVGYMGVYTDFIQIGNSTQKIAWLSTWWVHPKTKGTGIGRSLLNTMYTKQNGRIGISQFTESAKRVYDKSGYFVNLKSSEGVKAVLRSNLSFIIPIKLPRLRFLKPLLRASDCLLNFVINTRLLLCDSNLQRKLNKVSLEYLPFPDAEARALINQYAKKDISAKSNAFFSWLKAYHWVYEAPLLKMTDKSRYAFSMYDASFEYYYIKISALSQCLGFLVLQKRATTLKVLFTYFDENKHAKLVMNVINKHAIKLNIREIICYEPELVKVFLKSKLFLYKRKRLKQSILSKSYGVDDFSELRVNFGDGDCCFA